jgi:hypothetical protein
MMHRWLLFLCIAVSLPAVAQYKSFRISDRGDTLNIIDQEGRKQGKWLIHTEPLRGNPGYDEEGVFVNNRKEGLWRQFSLMGDLLAEEHYKWGNKNGICRYYSLYGLEREESWRAINPDKATDTVDVPDPADPNKVDRVVVKNTGHSLKNGTWRYFDPRSRHMLGSEKYVLDVLQQEDAKPPAPTVNIADSTSGHLPTDTAKAASKMPKPKEVIEFEKKNAGKKKKVRDGRTGG